LATNPATATENMDNVQRTDDQIKRDNDPDEIAQTRERAGAYAAEMRAVAAIAPEHHARDFLAIAECIETLIDGNATSETIAAAASKFARLRQEAEQRRAALAAEERDSAPNEVQIADIREQCRSGLAGMERHCYRVREHRDLIRKTYDAARALLPPGHPDLTLGARVLRDAESQLAETEERLRAFRDAYARSAQRCEQRRTALAAVDAMADAPPLTRARALVTAQAAADRAREEGAADVGRLHRLTRQWYLSDRKHRARSRRDGGAFCRFTARRAPRARARRRGGARHVARAPASDGESGSDPPSSAADDVDPASVGSAP
jgi:hypothetical protein